MGYNSEFISAVPLSAGFESEAQQVLDAKLYTVQARFSGATCAFTAHIEVSSEPYNNTPGHVPAVFDPLADSSKSFTEAGSYTWDVDAAGYVWARLVITDDSSGGNDGEISARINVKGPGI